MDGIDYGVLSVTAGIVLVGTAIPSAAFSHGFASTLLLAAYVFAIVGIGVTALVVAADVAGEVSLEEVLD